LSDKQAPPVATLLLIAANMVAAFALLSQPQLVAQLGFLPSQPGLHTALTSLFLHQNVLHLLGNMVFLAAVGPAVETGAGTVRFLIVYFVGGLAGVFSYWAFSGAGAPPLIGASAAIASCIAYYNLRYLHLQVIVAPKIGMPILAMTALWLGLQVLGAFVTLGEATAGVSYWAHLGGFAAGLLLSMVYRAPKHARQDIGHEVIRRMDERSPAAKLAAAEHHLQEHPEDPRALREKADALAMLGDRQHECETLLKLLDLLPEAEQPPVLSRLTELDGLHRLPSLRRTLTAERLKQSHPDLAKQLLLSVVSETSDESQRPDALLALAGIEIAEAPERARQWLAELAQGYPLHPACDLARARGWLK
jgi:membrane associated rhomboid family serine protease